MSAPRTPVAPPSSPRQDAPPAPHRLDLPASTRRLAFLSDLHLGPHAPRTTEALLRWLAGPGDQADALFILGDLFEAWIGDDLLDATAADLATHPELPALAAQARRVCQSLRDWAQRRSRELYVQHGNRDFLLGPGFARHSGATLIPDPTLLTFAGQTLLLTHGDQLCLADTAYLQFRAQVRQPDWQAAILATPLAARVAQAAALRAASRAAQSRPELWADADPVEAQRWLRAAGSRWMIHGHTHRPRDHWAAGSLRQVLADWDGQAAPPRAQALWLCAQNGPEGGASAPALTVHRSSCA